MVARGDLGVELCIVIGAGNIFRGVSGAAQGMTDAGRKEMAKKYGSSIEGLRFYSGISQEKAEAIHEIEATLDWTM